MLLDLSTMSSTALGDTGRWTILPPPCSRPALDLTQDVPAQLRGDYPRQPQPRIVAETRAPADYYEAINRTTILVSRRIATRLMEEYRMQVIADRPSRTRYRVTGRR